MERSDSINELAKALSAAQAEMKPAKRTKTNPFFKSGYADLEDVWNACGPALAKHGLSVAQLPGISPEGKATLETVVMHSSGQWVSGEYPVIPVKGDPQSLGSAYTYARRYSLSAVVGVVTEDDDGNAAAEPAKHPTPAPASTSSQADWEQKVISEKQLKMLHTLASKAGYDSAAMKIWISEQFGRQSSKELTQKEASKIIDQLKRETEGQ